jgi:ribosomal protein S12 methylthiotransferase accessory factor
MLKGYDKHKDASPIETIGRIRKILSDIGILTIEVDWKNSHDQYYSVRVITSFFGYGVGTNGKGITTEYALASAYSEFMERLQNLLLFKRSFGLMKDTKILFPDSKMISKSIVAKSNKDIHLSITKGKSEDLFFEYGDEILCHSYYSINKKAVCFLPDSVLAVTGSNGMCAGNTPQEAIVQGICEILERYSVSYIYKNKLSVPNIDIKDLVGLDIFSYIKTIENSGYSLIIKDCTLSGKIPVLAVVIFNKNYSKALIKFGSDPNFEVALMRCLSEGFQGVSNNDIEKKMISFNTIDQTASISSNKCPDDFWQTKFINDFIKSKGEPNYKSAFKTIHKGSQDCLDFLLQRLDEDGHSIYIKDVSFLNYPSYHIFIPGLSELYGYDYAYSFSKAVNVIKPTLLNLKNSKSSDIHLCIEAIENFLDDPLHSFMYSDDLGRLVKDFSGINLSLESDLFSLNLEYLLCLLYYRVGDFEKAANNLNRHLKLLEKNNLNLGNIKYFKCILSYFNLKVNQENDNTIHKTLSSIFGNQITSEVFSDIGNFENAFTFLKLPTCGDCSSCESINECFYKDWLKMADILNLKLKENVIDQDNLSKIFNNATVIT